MPGRGVVLLIGGDDALVTVGVGDHGCVHRGEIELSGCRGAE